MAIVRSAAVQDQIRVLFRGGAVGGLSDAELLERFAADGAGSEVAFEAIVARHGPMVLSVCRQVVGRSHDAEDAFQATFLVLVRRAGSIRNVDSLGCWLHGVARRVAVRARVQASKRLLRECPDLPDLPGAIEEPVNEDQLAGLHREIDRLPEKYRAPLVLCELGGLSHAQAARRLSWPVGTVSGRLSRARELLRSRLAARHLIVPVGVLAAIGSPRPVSAALVKSTTQAGMLLAKGGLSASGLSMGAFALARGLLRARYLAGLKVVAGTLVAVGVGTGTAGLTAQVSAVASLAHAPERPHPSAEQPPSAATRDAIPRAPVVLGWHDNAITSMTFAADGKTLATGSRDATVKLWDLEARRELTTLRGHGAPILGLAFFPDDSSLASVDAACNVKVWDVQTGRERLSVTWLDPGPPPELSPEVGQASRSGGDGAETVSPAPGDCSGV